MSMKINRLLNPHFYVHGHSLLFRQQNVLCKYIFYVKGAKTMEVKQTVIKCITAILCVIAICVTSVSGVNKICDANMEIAQNRADKSTTLTDSEEIIQENDNVSGNGITGTDEDNAEANETTAPETGENETNQTISQNSGYIEKANDKAQQPSDSKIPSTKAEIINVYNDAIRKAVNGKVGFKKYRISDNEVVPLKALEVFASVKDKVYRFMGIGEENALNRVVEKGKWGEIAMLNVSRLTESDINNATCKKAGANYDIVIYLNDGSGSASKSNPVTQPNTPLDKSGICVGIKDVNEYDHKSATVIYDAVKGTYENSSVKESYLNAVVKATINSSTNQIVSLNVDWSLKVNIKIMINVDATADSHVKYSNFKY